MEKNYREFTSGATRDTSNGKLEYKDYINPLNDYSFAKYMLSKQVIGGEYRKGNNRQKGIPQESLFDSLVRHVEILKLLLGGYDVYEINNKGKVELQVYPMGKVVSFIEPLDYQVDKKTVENELNAIRFNSEALKLYELGYYEGYDTGSDR